MPISELTGEGIALAEGIGTLSITLLIAGEGVAFGEGGEELTYPVAPLLGEGVEEGEGVGFLTWPAPPRIPPSLDDLWFYGQTAKRDMPGLGVALADGTGML